MSDQLIQPVHILLASYEGARFLPNQLASIVRQTDPNWRLLARDDGSHDETLALLREAAAADPRIRVLEDAAGRLGSSGNFFRLMQAAQDEGAAYFALCDQDDVWHPDKLATLRAMLLQAEAADGASGARPCLVYSDLRWIDSTGSEIAGSHFGASCGAMPDADHRWLMAMNLIPGCAMLGNRALLERALMRTNVAHHDWWLALVAAATGELERVDRALVDYRLHDANAIGARSLLARCIGLLHSPFAQLARGHQVHWAAVANARALLSVTTPDRLNAGWSADLSAVAAGLGSSDRLIRLRSALLGPARRVGVARRILALAAAFQRPPENVGAEGCNPQASK